MKIKSENGKVFFYVVVFFGAFLRIDQVTVEDCSVMGM